VVEMAHTEEHGFFWVVKYAHNILEAEYSLPELLALVEKADKVAAAQHTALQARVAELEALADEAEAAAGGSDDGVEEEAAGGSGEGVLDTSQPDDAALERLQTTRGTKRHCAWLLLHGHGRPLTAFDLTTLATKKGVLHCLTTAKCRWSATSCVSSLLCLGLGKCFTRKLSSGKKLAYEYSTIEPKAQRTRRWLKKSDDGAGPAAAAVAAAAGPAVTVRGVQLINRRVILPYNVEGKGCIWIQKQYGATVIAYDARRDVVKGQYKVEFSDCTKEWICEADILAHLTKDLS